MLNIADLVMQFKADIEQPQDMEALDLIRIKYLGKKGCITKQIKALKLIPLASRPEAGKVINKVKSEIIEAIDKKKEMLKKDALNLRLDAETLDVSLPGRYVENGALHPVSCSIMCIEDFFATLGFSVIQGLEIEDDYHNFDALNIPVDHPARTNHDTFRFNSRALLRTHTSGIQIRTMKTQQPPIRIISSGRVYRNDYDKTHVPMFHQMEGLIVDTDISFTNLKGTLYDFLHDFFEENLEVRFRPSYFPFTEPSAEVDIMGQDGCWIEVLGCGMVHPKVLHNVSIDSDIYSGFAFGIGIERLTMLRYGVTDLRAFFENDLRFLKQFK